MYDITKSIQAQKKYCEENDVPHFAPHSGNCWSCRKNIYEPREYSGWNGGTYTSGITVEKAGSELVTGCPHCNRSYCD